MIKKLIFLLLLTLLYSCDHKQKVNASDSRNDSIRKYLDLARNDTLNFKIRNQYNDKALFLMTFSKNNKFKRNLLYTVSDNYYYSNEKEKFKLVNEKMLELSLKSNDSINIGRAYRNFGLYYMDGFNNEEAIKFLYKAELIFLKIKKLDYLSDIYLDKAFVFVYENDYINCESSACKALLNLNNTRDKRKVYDSYNLIAVSSNELKNYKKAIEYHQKALLIAKDFFSKSKSNLIENSQNNIGVVYQNINQHNTAIPYFKRALHNRNLLKQSPDLYAMLIDNLAYSKFKIKDNKNLPDLFFKALKIREEKKLHAGVIVSKLHLSEFYARLYDSICSKKFAVEALNLAKSTKTAGDILSSLNQLSIIDKENTIIYLKEYIKITDSLQTEERFSKDKFARVIYETNEITMQKDTAIKQKWIIGIISIVIILIVVLLLIITRQRNKQRELGLMQKQQKSNEDIYHLMLMQKEKEDGARQAEKKRIARELHDGIMNRLSSTRLGLSILFHNTDRETIQKCLTQISGISEIESEIRSISHELNREVFQKGDSFINMLQDFVNKHNETSKTYFELEIDKTIDWNNIGSEIKMNLYRILQEASHNINKHAEAKYAIINLVLDEYNLCIMITDDGIGFDTSTISKGIGIQNIATRIKLLNGKFTINSVKGNTSINIIIPV